MRYQNVADIIFIDINGKSKKIKDIREYPDYTIQTAYNMLDGENIDEIVTRKMFYGDGNEGLSYRILEANRIKFDENNYSNVNVGKIIIPTGN